MMDDLGQGSQIHRVSLEDHFLDRSRVHIHRSQRARDFLQIGQHGPARFAAHGRSQTPAGSMQIGQYGKLGPLDPFKQKNGESSLPFQFGDQRGDFEAGIDLFRNRDELLGRFPSDLVYETA